MSNSDFYRPAVYQILKLYRCDRCQMEMEMYANLSPPEQHSCGGSFVSYAETYPPNPDDWDEKIDEDTGEWVNRNPQPE